MKKKKGACESTRTTKYLYSPCPTFATAAMSSIDVLDPYYWAVRPGDGRHAALVRRGQRLQVRLVTDFAGSTNFVLLAVLTLCLQGGCGGDDCYRAALRLAALPGLFLLRVCKRRRTRGSTRSWQLLGFFGFWVYQMFWVFLCSMPVIYGGPARGVAPV